MAAIGTRVYVRADEVARVDTHDDNGAAVSIVWWRDAQYHRTGKQWLSWHRAKRCLRRVQFAGTSGAARVEQAWAEVLRDVSDRAHTVADRRKQA